MRPHLLHKDSNHLIHCRIVLPRKLRETLKLKVGQYIPFSWGKYRADAFIEGRTTGGVELIFGNEVHTWDERMGMKWEEGVLKIGPLIGILTTGPKNDQIHFIRGRNILREYVRAARDLRTTAFVFTPKDINWTTERINGLTLTGKGKGEKWVYKEFPFPDVIYNRVPHRSAEMWAPVQFAKQELKDRYEIPIFNPDFFGKDEVYRLLLQSPVTSVYIPETKPLTSLNTLQAMSKRHPLLYAKPIHGSLGIGIMQIQQRERLYELRYQRKGKSVSYRFYQMEPLYSFIRRIAGQRHYVIQQGIDLRQTDGRVTDFRMHLHKNGSGMWEVIGIGAKVAGDAAVTTHVHNGGVVMDADEVFHMWYGEYAEMMKAELCSKACLIAQTIEQFVEGTIGELGLDMGFDQQDRIWMFEANAKPGRAIFRHPRLRKAGVRSARKIIEYCTLLSGFSSVKEVHV
ncbi:hypothetical protein DNHGIG_34440 [Collibacillus ludicampi]|uniref:YheC/YheD family protein n=1 Tax=Collibacillus ludicampi TaxID=2771369 RepID=A0AAV4LJD7_9BACL|nr:YheC/YheD family protein [Collibacillus ludicampi]GIM47895.1 hypothetical protein DNHGIG_34440 [Collibacillus ludicampi]